MKISRTILYAVQAMLELADVASAGPVSCRQIAATRQMPERFLLQILRNLVTHGLLTSARGVDGGYTLKRPAMEITLLDLIEALEGPVSAGVPVGRGLSEPVGVELRRICTEIAAMNRLRLDQVTVANLSEAQSATTTRVELPRPVIAPLLAPDSAAPGANGVWSDASLHDRA